MTRLLDVDHLVVGAGAAGMAFTDALIDHSDARVAMVDRRDGVGGHWRHAYPFVQLHQSSTFYGVASTLLGGGRVQTDGPEAGLHERADQPTILAYYDDVLARRMVGPGRVELFTGCDYLGGRTFVSRETGERYAVPERCTVVDARYVAPDIPAETPPRFTVDGAHVVPVNALPDAGPASRYVVVGSGKTATDSVVWLLRHGVDPDRIRWVRPREPWMLDRANVQPEPTVYLGMVADQMQVAAGAPDLPTLFAGLEEAGIMMRIDPAVTPSMAKAPTLGRWELELLRSVEDVVRLGRVRVAGRDRLELDDGSVALGEDALVVNCAADGLKQPPRVPVWQRDRENGAGSLITVQPVRAGFPCFGAALIGYVEATRDDDAEKNRLCPPSVFGNSLVDWARMNVLGFRASAAFGAEPDVKAWSDRVALNPARVAPEHPRTPALTAVQARLAAAVPPGLARLEELSRPA
ncbi:Pyridine nucleotide-disulphide oxidoreductase [Microlunatus sagamiharensis]|uniref:Pyridine nucleotide-disulphide oxidoreductase n=1 Tax=Microlunatus sagamiharensis TaxID=546874 RepID=A0A1H2MTJ7_9ACTN|nr:NAD(P)-binding protein [Microlunatus sagamiharensis]SDU95876.1 Pyridine nucleotide-disulphide oxidoreductase [Microlunatus sagamiharensis]